MTFALIDLSPLQESFSISTREVGRTLKFVFISFRQKFTGEGSFGMFKTDEHVVIDANYLCGCEDRFAGFLIELAPRCDGFESHATVGIFGCLHQ